MVDVDGDGRCEVVVPDSGATKPAGGYRGVTMLDGGTGKTRWVRPMRPDTEADDRLEHVTLAPDLDQDGTRDLVIFSRFDGRQPAVKPSAQPTEPEAIYVDAISGRDGHPLWWWRAELEQERAVGLHAPLWWGRGPDGWPLLAIGLGGYHQVYSGVAGNRPGVVHVLEASTGREVHRVEGLLSPAVADLDGDGLPDLWGEADGQLRAFRGPMPEAWRALGYYEAVSRYSGPPDDNENHTADLDGDGIGDALLGELYSPYAKDAPGSHTVVVRSGRDGHLLWKTAINRQAPWSDDETWTRYEAKTFGLPDGDFDGDLTCDVVVKSQMRNPDKKERARVVPLDLLSGRTGRRLWSAGNLDIDRARPGSTVVQSFKVCRIEPEGESVILAVLLTPIVKPGGTPMFRDPYESRLARLSGRDGRVVWAKLLLDQIPVLGGGFPALNLGDLDGDGSRDAVVLIPLSDARANRGLELRAVSLRDGEPFWSRKITHIDPRSYPSVAVGDIDRDNRAEIVVVSKQVVPGNKVEIVLSVFDGRDGEVRWSWHDRPEQDQTDRWFGNVCLADFDGAGKRTVCLGLSNPSGRHRVVIFDNGGHETAHRDVSGGQLWPMSAVDVNGDGRDELVLATDQSLQIVAGDLKEIWSVPETVHTAGFVTLPSGGPAPTLLVHPALGRDAATGHPRWAGNAHGYPFNIWRVDLVDPGEGTRLPLLFPWSSRQVCYQALPATATGKFAPPHGKPVPPGLARNDPRWTRGLPSRDPLRAVTGATTILTVVGLAFVNVAVPLLVLRLAARRRRFTMRVLMALPVAAAVPLMALLTVEPIFAARSDPWIASAKLEFAVGTLVSLPILAYAAVACLGLVARRWKGLGGAGRAHNGLVSDHRGRLDLGRQEVDAGDRTLRVARLVPGLHTGCLRGRCACARRGNLPRGFEGRESMRFLEQSIEQIRRRRKSIQNAAIGAIATVLLAAGSVAGWRFYAEWREGRIELITEDAPVVAQVLAESDDTTIGEPFDLVTRAVITLPAGEYRLRVNGMGRLGRTYRFTVNRGEKETHSISIDEGRLLGGERGASTGINVRPKEVSRPFARVTVALELTPGKADLIEWSKGSLVRFDCSTTGKVVWDACHPGKPVDRSRDPGHWLRDFSPNSRRAELVNPAPDLDGDGTGDILCVLPGESAFLALSGKDGSMLWNYIAELDGPGGPKPDGPVFDIRDKPAMRYNSLLGAPVMADVDRDGSLDLIATIYFSESAEEVQRRTAGTQQTSARRTPPLYRRVVTAVSGRSGRLLWSHPIDKSFRARSQPGWNQTAAFVYGRPPFVAIADGAQWLALDPATGRPLGGPVDLGFVPSRQVQHADLDGDGEPEILALGRQEGQQALAAIDVKTGRRLWIETGRRMYEEPQFPPLPEWPLAAHLDRNGGPEIVVPNVGTMPPLSGYRGVRLLDGLTGKTRWSRPMRPDTKASDGLEQILIAPDLDGDATSDIVTVSVFEGKNPATTAQAQPEEPERVYVDAFSGRDGRPLWWWSVDLPVDRFTRVWKPLWWGRGPDGWPLLVIPLGGKHPTGVESSLQALHVGPPVVHVLEASTGREVHTVTGLTRAGVADLDGDGLADLWGEVDGELRAFRGEAPEAWRALGLFHPPDENYGWIEDRIFSGVDLDGDKIGDALIAFVRAPGGTASQTTGSRTAIARSGRDGHVIWKTVLDPREHWFEPSRGESYGLRVPAARGRLQRRRHAGGHRSEANLPDPGEPASRDAAAPGSRWPHRAAPVEGGPVAAGLRGTRLRTDQLDRAPFGRAGQCTRPLGPARQPVREARTGCAALALARHSEPGSDFRARWARSSGTWPCRATRLPRLSHTFRHPGSMTWMATVGSIRWSSSRHLPERASPTTS